MKECCLETWVAHARLRSKEHGGLNPSLLLEAKGLIPTQSCCRSSTLESEIVWKTHCRCEMLPTLSFIFEYDDSADSSRKTRKGVIGPARKASIHFIHLL